MRRIPASLSLTVALATLTSALSGQSNLILNGDFETGSLKPWVESGWACSTAIAKHDCDGTAPSETFSAILGGKAGQTRQPNGYWPGNSIEQNVLTIQSLTYLFTADIQIQNIQAPGIANADAGMVEIFVDGTAVGKHEFGRFNPNVNDNPRARMCFTFQATSTGQVPLKVEFSRKYYCSSRTPTVFLDNATLIQAPVQPIICPLGERFLNQTADISIQGTASANFALYLGLAKLPSGIAIPGFNGAWSLSGPVFQLFVVQFDSSGHYSFQPAIPNDPTLAGLLLHWQAIEAATSGVSIGEACSFAFYN